MFEGNPTIILGFEIPYDGRLFLTILSIHVLVGLACVVTGLIAMLSKKSKGKHTKAGSVYFWSLLIVYVTATLIAIARWKEDQHLFFLGTISFIAAFTGRRAQKQQWNKWSIYHISGMSLSYIFLLIAFYVDNGRFLPVWKELDPVIYWLLPLLLGIPLLIRTLLTNPFSRHYFSRRDLK